MSADGVMPGRMRPSTRLRAGSACRGVMDPAVDGTPPHRASQPRHAPRNADLKTAIVTQTKGIRLGVVRRRDPETAFSHGSGYP